MSRFGRRARFISWGLAALGLLVLAAWIGRNVVGGWLATLWQAEAITWPEPALWGGLLVVGGLHFLWLILGGTHWPAAARIPRLDPGRVASWLGVLRVGQSAPRLLSRALLQLLVEVVSQVEQQSPEDVRANWHAGRLPLPPSVQAYLNQAGQPHPRSRQEAVDLEKEVTALVAFLEQYVSRLGATGRPEDTPS